MSVFKAPSLTALKNSLMFFSVLVLSACGSTPDTVETVSKSPDWSVTRVVQTDKSMITLFDTADLIHHQNEPAEWYLRDFAIADDLKSGRFAAVLTDRSGKFDVRLTMGELNEAEKVAAGPEAKMRLRVINRRLLLGGGDAWPSIDNDYKQFAYDERWIGFPNGDYGVIITAMNPQANVADYVFQLFPLDDMTIVKHVPAMPQLIYGENASVVGLNAPGYQYNEQCQDVPGQAQWVPLASRSMPIPGAKQSVELPRSLHQWALAQQRSGNNASLPLVLSRDTTPGSFGFYIKPSSWRADQVEEKGQANVKTLIRCAVQITEVVPEPDSFKLRIKAIPTASDSLPTGLKRALLDSYHEWITKTNDPAWSYRESQVKSSNNDAALVLGILNHLNLSSKETEKLLPVSNALRAEYLLERLPRLR